MRFTSLVAAVAFCAPLAFGADGIHEAGADLHHAEGGYWPHAVGNVGIREGSDFQRFTVTVREVGGDATLIVQLGVAVPGTTRDEFVDVGTMAATAIGRVLNLTTLEGGHLPLEATAAHQLSGHAVRVVDGDHHPILIGTVPTFDTTEPPHDPPPHDPPTTTDPPPADITARAEMVRPEDSPYDDSRGVIVAVKRAESEALRIEVGHLAPSTHYGVFIGDDGDGTQIGDFTANDNGGASMTRDTAAGTELPLGASLADLAGRHVEIRHEGVVVLLGAIPHVEDHHDVVPVHHDVREHDEESGAVVRVIVDIRPRIGRELCDVRMGRLPTHEESASEDGAARSARRRATADLFMDDGTGTMRQIGSARINRFGHARLRFITRRGGSLPLSAATLRELAGRALEVRVNGRTRVATRVPGI